MNYPIDDPVSGGTWSPGPCWPWIFADETYTELYHQYFAEFLAEYFDSGYFAEMLDQVETLIAPLCGEGPHQVLHLRGVSDRRGHPPGVLPAPAESVSGQLEGTIPATSEGQAAGSASLIDASHIVISDMGSMNGGMGGGRGGFDGLPGGGQFPVLSEDIQPGEEDTAPGGDYPESGGLPGAGVPGGPPPLRPVPAGGRLRQGRRPAPCRRRA